MVLSHFPQPPPSVGFEAVPLAATALSLADQEADGSSVIRGGAAAGQGAGHGGAPEAGPMRRRPGHGGARRGERRSGCERENGIVWPRLLWPWGGP